MYTVESKSGAIGCMLIALVLLGTWPAILAKLERRGRLPQHTYLDYSLTNFLTAILMALTLGQIGDANPTTPNFFTQLSQVPPNHILQMFSRLLLNMCEIEMAILIIFSHYN